MFDNQKINCMAYNIETILAEKIETILSRSIANTRPRDFYDIHVLLLTFRTKINFAILKKAITQTANKRGSIHILPKYKDTVTLIEKNQIMINHWEKYRKSYTYASPYSFS
jgi:predicted nucleotidyltransferase component of viral defense system